MITPCIKLCKIHKEVCIGCHRTLNEIAEWSDMSMEDRMKVMEEIKTRRSTHTCPSCHEPTYCAMEAGKSSNLCWCMYETMVERELDTYSTCLCKKCLIQENT